MRATFLLLAIVLWAIPAAAAVPPTLNYQGVLTSPTGTPVTGTLSMTFRIYNVSSGGAALWSETQNVGVVNGVFNATLGSTTPVSALPFDAPYFLGVTVNPDPEMTPRQPLASGAYAQRAATADAVAATATVASTQITGQITGGQLPSNLSLGGTTSGTFSGPLTGNVTGDVTGNVSGNVTGNLTGNVTGNVAGNVTGNLTGSVTGDVTGNVTGNAGTATKLATARTINGVAFDGTANISIPLTPVTGCPGPRINGSCLIAYTNAQTTNFATAAQTCANAGGDICTDSQQWTLFSAGFLSGAHWTASFGDNDGLQWNGANGGTGDDHSALSSYGYACCGGYTPAFDSVAVTTTSGVKTTAIHNIADTTFAGAVTYCSALYSDICSDSQTLLLRSAGALSVATWTNSHSDNDGTLYNAINGGTNDDTIPSQLYGFACCPSRRPSDLSCPVSRTSGVCAVSIHNTADATFAQAAQACATAGGDVCSIAQSAVLRSASALTAALNWTNSHSDNDSNNASVGVGAMADNPNLSTPAGYACCLN